MVWYGRFWFLLLSTCCLFLLVSCSGNGTSEENQTGQDETEPSVEELGLRLPPVPLNLEGLSQPEISQVARGSYLANGAAGCPGCHSSPAGYLAGGQEFPVPFLPPDVSGFTSVFSRNLTPEPETGLQMTEEKFLEVMRTGKDLFESTNEDPQRLIIHPWHLFRFMSLQDLKDIFAFLQRIPLVSNPLRKTYKPPFPFPPTPLPPIGDGDPVNDPQNAERGLLIPQFFSSGPDADAFVAHLNTMVTELDPEEQTRVGRGSYLVNALADCNGCRTDADGDGSFDEGLIPGTAEVNTTTYLAGGVNMGVFFGLPIPLFSRNLTLDPTTGLLLTEEEFIQSLRFGADFQRPGGSLRLPPHFPTEFHFTLEDLKAVYAYLRIIPPRPNFIEITP